jgi:hypothetical protein
MAEQASGNDVDFFEEVSTTTGADRFQAEITNLARELRGIEGEIATLQNQIKDLGRRKLDIESKQLPNLLQQAGVKEITTLEGLKVATKFVVGSIPAESKQAAYDWLDSHGHADLIKRSLSLQFGKGDTKQAELAKEKLVELGFDPQSKLDVHPQTFMAFAREQITNGKMLPLEQWGVWFGDKATVK